MKPIDYEKLNQLVARTDISGNDKVMWLEDFISGRELQQQERSYSEEEVENIVNKTVDKFCTFFSGDLKQKVAKEWFEQFKKQ